MDIYFAEVRVVLHPEDEPRILKQHDALGASGQGKLRLAPEGAAARIALIARWLIHEPLARYRPFTMNSRSQLEAAFQHYQSGQVGHLPPLEY